ILEPLRAQRVDIALVESEAAVRFRHVEHLPMGPPMEAERPTGATGVAAGNAALRSPYVVLFSRFSKGRSSALARAPRAPRVRLGRGRRRERPSLGRGAARSLSVDEIGGRSG